jgi:hypothetical protein
MRRQLEDAVNRARERALAPLSGFSEHIRYRYSGQNHQRFHRRINPPAPATTQEKLMFILAASPG